MSTSTDFTGLQFTDTNDNKNEIERMGLLEEDEDEDEGEEEEDEGCGTGEDEERPGASADGLSESEIVVDQGSVTVEKDMCDGLDVGSFGPENICFYGEVGYWKDSGPGSQMVNALQVDRGHQQKQNLRLIHWCCVLTQAKYFLRPLRPVRPELCCNAPLHPIASGALGNRGFHPDLDLNTIAPHDLPLPLNIHSHPAIFTPGPTLPLVSALYESELQVLLGK